MSDLEDDVLAYRAKFGNAVTPTQKYVTVADFALGNPVTNDKVLFSYTNQIIVIEPWGLHTNIRARDSVTKQGMDYANAEDYGIVLYHSQNGSTIGTIEELLAHEDAYVFSKAHGNNFIDGAFFCARYYKNILTYQLDTAVLSFAAYYVIDGEYYYSGVVNRTVSDVCKDMIRDAHKYEPLQIAVYDEMGALNQAVTAYRKEVLTK